jgi:hypothetical protein
VSLDTYFKGKRINVIKMDVQGYEPYVMDGAKETITWQKNLTLFAEVFPAAIEQAGRSPEGYIESIRKLGFKISTINENKGQIEPFDEKKAMQRHVGNLQNDANLLCKKED